MNAKARKSPAANQVDLAAWNSAAVNVTLIFSPVNWVIVGMDESEVRCPKMFRCPSRNVMRCVNTPGEDVS